MHRLAVLATVLLLAACAQTGTPVAVESGCAGCHAPHRRERDCVSCHRGDALAQRKELAHHGLIRGRVAEHAVAGSAVVREGEQLVNAFACRRCHTIAGSGGTLATSLDKAVWKRDQSALFGSIAEPVEFMPRFGMTPRQREATVAYLLRSAGSSEGDTAYRVYFERRGESEGAVFDRRCGGCHRALLARGPAGRGSAGPNLSGLLSPFYPANAANASDKRWTAALLADWLRNPRTIRPATTMRPIALDEGELERLVGEMAGEDSVNVRTAQRDPVILRSAKRDEGSPDASAAREAGESP